MNDNDIAKSVMPKWYGGFLQYWEECFIKSKYSIHKNCKIFVTIY